VVPVPRSPVQASLENPVNEKDKAHLIMLRYNHIDKKLILSVCDGFSFISRGGIEK